MPNITNASAPEPSAATPEPLELAPPPPLPSVNVRSKAAAEISGKSATEKQIACRKGKESFFTWISCHQ